MKFRQMQWPIVLGQTGADSTRPLPCFHLANDIDLVARPSGDRDGPACNLLMSLLSSDGVGRSGQLG
jgi:hypothetical protein